MTPCCFDGGEKGKRLLVASVRDLRPLNGHMLLFCAGSPHRLMKCTNEQYVLISSSEVDVSSSCFSVVGHGINSITVLSSFTSELKTRAFLFSDTINTCWRVNTC